MDPRSRANIDTLHPDARPWAEAFLEAAAKVLPPGYEARIISGNRTFAEQDELYAQGRTKPGAIVTNAKGGQSNHNYGVAWDIGIFRNGKYLPESEWYAQLGPVGRALGLAWGGDWHVPDMPHYEVRTGRTVSQLRELVEEGMRVPVPKYPGKGLSLTVLGKQVADPILVDGVTYAPVRALCEAAGLRVEFDQASKSVAVTKVFVWSSTRRASP